MKTLGVFKHKPKRIDETLKDINEKYDLNDVVLLQSRVKTLNIEVVKKEDLLGLKNNYNYYELITRYTPSKIYFDFDNKSGELELLSYNDIFYFMEAFKKYLTIIYNIEQDIKYSIHISIEGNYKWVEDYGYDYKKTNEMICDYVSKNVNEKFIQSCHIIINCQMENNLMVKYCIDTFFKSYSINFENLYSQYDNRVYSSNKKFRCINQTKEEKDKVLKKIKCINGMVELDETIDDNDFITYLTDQTIKIKDNTILDYKLNDEKFLSNCEDETNEIKFNIEYAIKQDTILKNYLNETQKKETKLIYTASWLKIAYTIIQAYYLKYNSFDGIYEDEYIKLFLQISKVGKYNNATSYENNLKKINSIVNNKTLVIDFNAKSKFIRPLTISECKFIYDKLNINYNAPLKISRKLIDKSKVFLDILNIETNKKLALYNLNNYILTIDYKIIKFVDTDGKNREEIKKKLGGKDYCFLQTEEMLKNKNKIKGITEIDNFDLVNKNINQNVYTIAPCGSGKTRSVLLPNIKDILKVKPNKIMLITETRSLSDKLYSDLINNEILNEKQILLYKDNKRSSKYLNKPEKFNKIRVLIVCYRSLIKFKDYNPTHILIDEWKNLSNNFTGIIGEENNVKDIESKYLFKHFNELLMRKVIKIYDANIDEYDIVYLNSVFGNFEYYKLTGFIQRNNRVILQSEDLTIKELIANGKQGKRGLIASSGRDKLIDLETRLSNKSFKTLYMDKDGATGRNIDDDLPDKQELKRKFVNDPNNEDWLVYLFILFTATITCGLSIDNPVFFRTYLFLSMGGSNILQSSQMIERARNNQDKTLVITAYDDKFHTLKNTHIKVSNVINKENMKILNNNIKNNCFNRYINKNFTELNTELNLNIKKGKLYEYWKCISSYLTNQSNNIKIFKIMETLYEWGHRDFEVNFYEEIKDNEIDETIINQVEDETENIDICFSVLHKNALCFMNTLFTDGEIEKNAEPTNEISKRVELKRYGYTTTLYNKINEFEKSNDKTFLALEFNKALRKTQFNNLKLFKYYEIKEVIYELFENFNFDYKTEKQNQDIFKNKLKKLASLYVVFKIFEDSNIEVEDLNDVLNTFPTGIFPQGNKDGAKINISSYDKYIKQNEVIHYYLYENQEPKDSLKNYFSNIGIDFKLNGSTISGQMNIRTQLNRYYHPYFINFNKTTHFKSDREENTYDDVFNYFECDKSSGMCFMLKEMPKIRKVRSDFMNDKFIIDLQNINKPISDEVIAKSNIIINKSFVEINDDEYEIKLNNFVFPNPITATVEELTEQIKNAETQAKEEKTKDKQKAKDNKRTDRDVTRSEKIICFCGGSYCEKKKKDHFKTKKHLKAEEQNKINEMNPNE